MKYADKIGKVFQRLHSRSEFPGTGIGMASVKQIILRHGGTVTVHGEPNAGAVVEFSLWDQQ
jgi:chemotaxis family two-component system sensor kinase Cph1